MSGSTLRGKAKQYHHRYQTLREELFERMQVAGVVFSEQWLEKRHVLVIGAWPEPPRAREPPAYLGPITCMDDLFL